MVSGGDEVCDEASVCDATMLTKDSVADLKNTLKWLVLSDVVFIV
jgi:hypothetical protein